MQTHLFTSFSHFLPKFFLALTIFLVFWLIGVVLSWLIRNLTKKTNHGRKQIFILFAQITHIGMLIFGLITALGTVGINVSALVAGLGLTSFGLGFALKDALSNTISGILVLLYRPFKINDKVMIGNLEGIVKAIDLRYITLEADEKITLIPNANLFNTAIVVLKKSS